MWSKLDDALLDHRKVFDAGDRIGKDGPCIALGLYVIGLLWTNKQLSDGYLPRAVVKRFRHCEKPLMAARALVSARLWDAVEGGFQIHDYHDHNFSATEINLRRQSERERRRKGGRNTHGNR